MGGGSVGSRGIESRNGMKSIEIVFHGFKRKESLLNKGIRSEINYILPKRMISIDRDLP